MAMYYPLEANRSTLFLLLVCLGLLGGCDKAPPSGSPPLEEQPAESATGAGRDAALALLASLDREAFRQAFERLAHYHYTRQVRTVQLNRQGELRAYLERTLRYNSRGEEPAASVLEVDSSGTFAFGLLGRFAVGGEIDVERPTRLTERLLPEEPAYLSERNREAFLYSLEQGTTRAGRPVRILVIEARPGEGDEQTIRRVRLYVERQSRQLVALYLERADQDIFFSERSRLYAETKPTSDGAYWLPSRTRFHAQLDLPLQPPRAFRTSSVYYDYERGG